MQDRSLMKDSTIVKVQDIASSQKNALVGGPFGSNLVTSDYTDSGIPVIRGQNMGQGRWVTGDFAFVTEEKANSLKANIARPADLIFTQRGTLGQVAIIPSGDYDEYLISQSQMKLTVDSEKADTMFLYYSFVGEEQQQYIRQNAIQTGVPHTNLTILRNTPVTLPPIGEQKAIAKILSAFDDRIELNRRMNATLEAMARALFKAWFVDFEPVHANRENRPSTSASPEIAKLFPSTFENGIPKGWKAGSVGQNFNLTMGRSPSGDTYNQNGEGEVFYQGRTDFGFRFPAPRVYCTQPATFAEKGDTLLSVRAPVGDVNIAPDKCCIGRGIAAIRHKSGSSSFTYYNLWNLASHFENFESEGTVFGSITKIGLQNTKIVEPIPQIIKRFDKLVGTLDRRIETNSRQNLTLSEIRDSLLPRLISGRIGIKAPLCNEHTI